MLTRCIEINYLQDLIYDYLSNLGRSICILNLTYWHQDLAILSTCKFFFTKCRHTYLTKSQRYEAYRSSPCKKTIIFKTYFLPIYTGMKRLGALCRWWKWFQLVSTGSGQWPSDRVSHYASLCSLYSFRCFQRFALKHVRLKFLNIFFHSTLPFLRVPFTKSI